MATYDFTVRAEDERGAFSDRTFSIQVQNNLVDRMAIISATDLYASVDGKTFTKRIGKGGRRVHYMLNKWWVIQDNFNYRTSPDTINWTEGLQLKVADDHTNEVYRGELFTFDHSVPFEYGGTIYVIGQYSNNNDPINRRVGIFKTTDLIKWYPIDSTFDMLTHTTPAYKSTQIYSNIVRHNSGFLFYDLIQQKFYHSTDMENFTVYSCVNPSNFAMQYVSVVYPLFAQSYPQVGYSRITSVNGVVQAYSLSIICGNAGTSSNGSGSSRMFWTTDLRNYNAPIFAAGAVNISYNNAHLGATAIVIPASGGLGYATPKAPLYFNGHNIMLMGSTAISLKNPLAHTRIGSTSHSAAWVSTPIQVLPSRLYEFDGKLYGTTAVTSTAFYSEWDFNESGMLVSTPVTTTGLESNTSAAIFDMAVRN